MLTIYSQHFNIDVEEVHMIGGLIKAIEVKYKQRSLNMILRSFQEQFFFVLCETFDGEVFDPLSLMSKGESN